MAFDRTTLFWVSVPAQWQRRPVQFDDEDERPVDGWRREVSLAPGVRDTPSPGRRMRPYATCEPANAGEAITGAACASFRSDGARARRHEDGAMGRVCDMAARMLDMCRNQVRHASAPDSTWVGTR